MLHEEDYRSFLPNTLYQQIQEVYQSFREIQSEVLDARDDGGPPEASAELHDVLQSTEDATNRILDAAAAIGEVTTNENVTAEISKIYEACNFQDLTGQRIKKVLGKLDKLEVLLQKLAETAEGYVGEADNASNTPKEVSLMNGPQLTGEAPDQDAVDKLFNSF